MHPMQSAHLLRARSAIDFALEGNENPGARATAFKAFAFELLQSKNLEEARSRLARHANPLVAKGNIVASELVSRLRRRPRASHPCGRQERNPSGCSSSAGRE